MVQPYSSTDSDTDWRSLYGWKEMITQSLQDNCKSCVIFKGNLIISFLMTNSGLYTYYLSEVYVTASLLSSPDLFYVLLPVWTVMWSDWSQFFWGFLDFPVFFLILRDYSEAQVIIGVTVISIFYGFFCSPERSWYLYSFSFSFTFTRLSAGTANPLGVKFSSF